MSPIMVVEPGVGGFSVFCACGKCMTITFMGATGFRLIPEGQVTFKCPDGHAIRVDAESMAKQFTVTVQGE